MGKRGKRSPEQMLRLMLGAVRDDREIGVVLPGMIVKACFGGSFRFFPAPVFRI